MIEGARIGWVPEEYGFLICKGQNEAGISKDNANSKERRPNQGPSFYRRDAPSRPVAPISVDREQAAIPPC